MSDRIRAIEAMEILGSTGRPTVEVRLVTESGIEVESSVPTGTSKGRYEACEVYDGGTRFRGFGVRKAVSNVTEIIAPALKGKSVLEQREIDQLMMELDGTPNKGQLGSNAILATSIAVAKAGAKAAGLPPYLYLGGVRAVRLPAPAATVIAGGEYSPASIEFEDYILCFDGFESFPEALEALAETHYALGKALSKSFGVVPDVCGAWAPPLRSSEEAFEYMLRAAKDVGCDDRISLGLDIAATELFDEKSGMYDLNGRSVTVREFEAYIVELARSFPLRYIEDPFHEDAFDDFSAITQLLPDRMIVGDDIFVTNIGRLQQGIEKKAGNAMLMKINQIGTVTEAIDAAFFAREHGYDVAASVRSNETNDPFQADVAVAVGAPLMKIGSPVRGERNAKYNRLLNISRELGAKARFAKRTL
jgi:enolase